MNFKDIGVVFFVLIFVYLLLGNSENTKSVIEALSSGLSTATNALQGK